MSTASCQLSVVSVIYNSQYFLHFYMYQGTQLLTTYYMYSVMVMVMVMVMTDDRAWHWRVHNKIISLPPNLVTGHDV